MKMRGEKRDDTGIHIEKAFAHLQFYNGEILG